MWHAWEKREFLKKISLLFCMLHYYAATLHALVVSYAIYKQIHIIKKMKILDTGWGKNNQTI
jgi:hypothetical protein